MCIEWPNKLLKNSYFPENSSHDADSEYEYFLIDKKDLHQSSDDEEDEGSDKEDDMIHVGDTFKSFKHLKKRVDKYQETTNCVFYRRDSVTIEQCRKKGIKKPIKERLKYYNLKYTCTHGGRNSKSSECKITQVVNNKCLAFIKIGVSKNGEHLVVKEISNEHNHEISKHRNYSRIRSGNQQEKTTESLLNVEIEEIGNLKVDKSTNEGDY